MEFSLTVLAFMLALGLMVFVRRRSTARNEVWRLVHSGGLPQDERLMAAAEERLVQRQVATAAGSVAAGLVGVLVLWAVGSDVSSPILGWTLVLSVAGAGLGISIVHSRAVRAVRPAGSRTATLRQRQLADYLTRFEIVGQYAMLVFPLLALVLGVLILVTADDHQARGLVLAIPALAMIPFAVLGVHLQRQILHLNQPASGEPDLRWQEALRAKALRDMGNILGGAGWLFGSASVLSFDWPAGLPAFIEPLGWVMFVAGTGLWALILFTGESKWGLRRSQEAIG
ncbi:hypothetical protein AB0P21_26645 [Kribbella sp. NPDC056861]|uniref:hypothetical protein n=1 Tax=Kribbella sp. NPDC056861 TaxID=3154857 RepID=UPI00341CFAB9